MPRRDDRAALPLPHRTVSALALPAATDSFEHLIARLRDEDGRTVAQREGLTFQSAFQPIYSLSHGRVVGHEALLRARNADGVFVPPPDVFRSNSFQELLWRDRTARMVHMANYFRQAPDDQWVFINVHPDVFAYGMGGPADGFSVRLRQHFGYDPSHIVIEVTEEVANNAAQFDAAIANARAVGCLIAIDDFGAGHSNFDRVWRWRPEIVKLDRSLVSRAASDSQARRVVVQMVSLLHECGALVLMEGVETTAEAVVALEADVDMVQGYLFGRPQPDLTPPSRGCEALEVAWQQFDRGWRDDREVYREATAPYLQGIAHAGVLLQGGSSMEDACKPFLSLPQADVCYLLGPDGRQLGPHVWTGLRDGVRTFVPLQDSEGARWGRRPYFRRAVDGMGKVQITRPYRTLHGGGLCVTVSAAIHLLNDDGQREMVVICGDVRWPNS
jgi:EAL domain-containing protein (putative c-di-GMP-specific phosphodiesterase class I)